MIDTNIIIDLRDEGRWYDWSENVLAQADDPILVSAIVVGELASRGGSETEIAAMLTGFGLTPRAFDAAAGYRAGVAFHDYRRAGGTREQLLADFMIGAHATVTGATLVTRDAWRYRRYFPDLPLITPETDDG